MRKGERPNKSPWTGGSSKTDRILLLILIPTAVFGAVLWALTN